MTAAGAQEQVGPGDGHEGEVGATSPTASSSRHTSLVGRAEAITDVLGLLGEHRLVTLTGAGGVGKTRLAQAAAAALATDERGFTFVDIATIDSPDLVPAAILAALGLRATASQTPVEVMASSLGSGESTLVLDNFEHVTEAASLVGELLDRYPGLSVLVTSRRRLRLAAERVYEVQPLGVPPRDESAERLRDYDSVRLFIDRATDAGASLSGSADEQLAIAEICRRLEGLPLAVELAAPHVRYLSIQALLGRLDEPLAFLADGPIDAPTRQRALRHSIAWSYDLLSAERQRFFGRLGFFEGPFTIEAVHDIAAVGLHDDEAESLSALAELTDHGLVRATVGGTTASFEMHDAIRDFARSVVDDPGDTQAHFIDHYIRLAERADPELDGAEQALWTERLVDELENLRGALGYAYRSSSTPELLRLATALGSFWRWHGDLREGREWLSRAVSAAQPGSELLLAKAQRRAARISSSLGDRDQALLLYGSARRNSEAVDDVAGVAEALVSTGMVIMEDGRPAEAAPLIEDGLERAEASDDPNVLAAAILTKGNLANYLGNQDEASRLFERSAQAARNCGNLRLAAVALVNLADTKLAEHDYAAAIPLITRGVDYLDRVGDLAYLQWALLVLGLAHTKLGELEAARSEIERGTALALRVASPVDLILAAEVLGYWLGASGEYREAVSLWSAATDAREDLDFPRQPWDDAWINEGIERDRSALPEDVARSAWIDGASTGLRAAIVSGEQALRPTSALVGRARAPLGRPGVRGKLTPREMEVLVLLARGDSTREVADSLSISPGTAAQHAASLKFKLSARNRVEVVTTALELGLIEPPPVA